MSVYGIQVEILVGNNTAQAAFQNFSVAFERAGAAIADFSQHVFPLLSPVFEDAIDAQFSAQGKGPAFGSWAALSPEYAAWKSHVAPGMPILELTGHMREGLTESNSPYAWRQWSASDFSFGTVGLPYDGFHQSGTSKMPARPPLDFGPDFETALKRATAKGMRDAIKAASRGVLEAEGVE